MRNGVRSIVSGIVWWKMHLNLNNCVTYVGSLDIYHAIGRKLTLTFTSPTCTLTLTFTLPQTSNRLFSYVYADDISALCIRIEHHGDDTDSLHSAGSIDLAALWPVLDKAARLDAVLVVSSEYKTLTRVLDAFPCLRESPSETVKTYRLACRDGYGEGWVGIDSKTM